MPISPQALALTLSGFMSGYYFSGAYVFIPAVAKTPSSLVAQQWKQAWDIGRYVGKIVVPGTAASFAYLAYNEPTKTGNARFQLFCVASAVVGVIVPFTIISSYPFNQAINDRLGEISGTTKAPEGAKDLKKLVIEWGRLDYYRSMLAFVGTIVGLSAFLV